MAGPSMLPEEDFEDAYGAKFDALILGRGLKVNYERDRAATDIGVMWTKPASRELSGVRVWFQLKGLHAKSASAEDVRARGNVPVKLDVGQLCFWYAAPEATYLVVYVESLDLFLGRDVRDIVDERWGPGILAPENLRDQASVTVHLETFPRATLCRCGLSKNKPFCDNSHLSSDFTAPGGRIHIPPSPVRPRSDEPIDRKADPRGRN